MKTSALFVRINPHERELFKSAAQRVGLSLSGWVRMVLLQAARKAARDE